MASNSQSQHGGLQLREAERGFYGFLLRKADPEGENRVRGPRAVALFSKSGLTPDKLKGIWVQSAKTASAYLTADEFNVALRLIAYEQNGMRADENSIQMNLEVQLPKFEGLAPEMVERAKQ